MTGAKSFFLARFNPVSAAGSARWAALAWEPENGYTIRSRQMGAVSEWKKTFPGLIAAAIVLVAYSIIMAPSISFWDCGEYVAAGSTLGILHPPGNPLYLILARAASSLFVFVQDPARRITLLSPLFASATAFFVYLSLVRILTAAAAPVGSSPGREKTIAIQVGAVAGALMAAFGSTVAFSSVEAEVNTPLLLPLAICTWMTIKWGQSRSPQRDLLLGGIALVSFLGIGIHMYAMIVMLSIFMYVMIVDPSKRTNWPFIVTSAALGLVMYRVSWFIWIGPFATIITLVAMLLEKKKPGQWQLCFQLALAAFLGFSVHFVIPVRSAENPAIDMGHPASFQGFVDYLDRKQYGSESMITRMFWRRGQLKNQFGIEGHMGFGGFWLTQFFKIDRTDTQQSLFAAGFARGIMKLLLYLSPTVLLFYGWILLGRKNRGLLLFIGSLTFCTTLLLVVYMNFADGTRPESRDYQAWQRAGARGPMPTVHREVRVRDYFFIGGFMYYGMGLGLASGLILLSLYDSRRRSGRAFAPFATVLTLLMPVIPMAENLPENSRAGDHIPANYAWNLLNSCEPNALLFTFGDNDTYPLWAMQEAYGIRKDVRVINLSLLNTDWYIRGLRDKEPRVPMTLSDKEIGELHPQRNPFARATQYYLDGAGISVTIPARDRKPYFLVQNTVLLHVVNANGWRRPIYFSSGAGGGELMGLEQHMRQEGIVYHAVPDSGLGAMVLDLERTDHLIDSVYRMDGFSGRRLDVDESSARVSGMFPRLLERVAYERLHRAWDGFQKLTKEGFVDSTDRAAITVAIHKEARSGMQRLEQSVKLYGTDDQVASLKAEFDRLLARL